MAKIKLGSAAKNFPVTIKVPMLDGTEGAVKVSYIYRTRTDFGELIDGLMNAAGLKPASTDDADIKATLAQAMERTVVRGVLAADGVHLVEATTLREAVAAAEAEARKPFEAPEAEGQFTFVVYCWRCGAPNRCSSYGADYFYCWRDGVLNFI